MSSQSVITAFGFYVLSQDEIGVCMTLGKYSGIVRPGPGWIFPMLQSILKTKGSLQTIDLPDQQIVLSGNIAVTISGSLNYRVTDPGKALLEVRDYGYSIRQLSLTTISDVLGTKTIEQVRTDKVKIADEIEKIVSIKVAEWGLSDVDIRLTDARLDESLLRAMMRETEARKEAKAIEIKAAADKTVAKTFVDAARTLASAPGAMTLRVLQTLSDVSNDKSTVIIPLPVDILNKLGGDGAALGNGAAAAESGGPPTAHAMVKAGVVTASCPFCRKTYNVGDILGKEQYDIRPDIPGQQVKCRSCGKEFTLKAG